MILKVFLKDFNFSRKHDLRKFYMDDFTLKNIFERV